MRGLNRFVVAIFLSTAGMGWGQTASVPSSSSDDPRPITGKQRVQWVAMSTVGPESLAGGAISAGWSTLFNGPREYGTHWSGFGERYGMRLTGIAVSHTMEAGLGSLWGEDPRYVRYAEGPFGARVGHIVKMTFMARNRDGRLMPAYARFVAVPASNFLSNTWRVDSAATTSRATVRIGLGFLGRMIGNTFEEFWPDARQKLFRKKGSATANN